MSNDVDETAGDEPVRFGAEVVASSGRHLRESRLFRGVANDVTGRYEKHFTLGSFSAGESLAFASSFGRSVHVIRRGKVRIEETVTRDTALVIGVLGPGEAFGLESLVADGAPSRSAYCIAPTLLLSAPSDALRPTLDESAPFARNVAAALAQALDDFALALRGVAHAPATQRVLLALQRVAGERGVAVTDGILLDCALGADDVASLTRSSTETAASALFFLEREGRIRINGSLIILLHGR